MAHRHRRVHSDASALSFAVIYDPEKGLQSFTEPIMPAYDDSDDSSYSPRGHILSICTGTLFGTESREPSPSLADSDSDSSMSVYSQESGTDESAETYKPAAPILPEAQPNKFEAKLSLRPKLSFIRMPSLSYCRVSFYRRKPVKTDSTTSAITPFPLFKRADTATSSECSCGPRLYTMLHRAHNASCSSASHATDSSDTYCEMDSPTVVGATHQFDFDTSTTSEDLHHSGVTMARTSEDNDRDVFARYIEAMHETWADFEFDPSLPSRFSVTTTSTSTYVEIDMDEMSFDESVRCYSVPFDDIPRFEPEVQSSPSSSPLRVRNLWRPKF